MRNADGDTVVGRAFKLLEGFGDGTVELTLDQLSSRTGLSRSTTHRLAHQLVAQGVLSHSSRGWRLGTRLFELGQLVAREQRLRERAVAYMQDLYVATGETIQLAVLDADEVLYVEIISGHRKVPTPSRRGGRMPLYCTALGKVLLAYSADGGRAYLDHPPPMPARTPRTITTADQLRRELHAVRSQQVAYDREEAAAGLQCVAAPILDASGAVVAALSVSMGTDGRLTPGEATPAVRTVARALSRETAPA